MLRHLGAGEISSVVWGHRRVSLSGRTLLTKKLSGKPVMVRRPRRILRPVVRVCVFHMYIDFAVAIVGLGVDASARVHGSGSGVANSSMVRLVRETVLQLRSRVGVTGSFELACLLELVATRGLHVVHARDMRKGIVLGDRSTRSSCW